MTDIGNNQIGDSAAITVQSNTAEHLTAPPVRPPRSTLGSARAIVSAVLTGRLRSQYYADVHAFGDRLDATAQVAAAYMCLAATIGMTISFFAVLAANPSHIEAHVLTAANAAGAFYCFLHLRRKRDPRPAMGWVILLHMVTIAVISFRHSGILAPIVYSLPAVAGVAALIMHRSMRLVALTLGVVVAVCIFVFASGMAGIPTPYSTQTHSIMSFLTVSFSTVALGGLVWISNLSRDYALERLNQANEEMTENTARSRVALEAAKVGLWDVPDAELGKFHVSESFHSITGYTGEEFNEVFGGVDKFVHPDDVLQLREAFAVGQKRMSRLRVDFRLKTKLRGYRWFSARARYSKNPDGTTRISGSLQDINFIKAAEEALRAGRDRAREANKAKSDFIAVMSHEVRTPLNAILGSVEVLKRGEHDRETAELVALIDDSGRGLLTIVNDMLDVSKIEAGKLEISPSPTDICTLVTRTVDFWRPQASNKGLVLNVDSSGAEIGAFMIDAGRVRQIVGNLVSNAIKFTDTGSITTIITTNEGRDGRVEALISVIDTGPGVPDAVAETIFAPFEQAPNNASRGGTGLGLFISRRLARLMGGDLTLEPARRDGAHFRLSLTVARSANDDQSAISEREDPAWAGKRVLCVDDNENNRRIAQLLLGKFGIEVQACASGAEAIDLCAIETFDVILMDIVMPDMDGIETLKQLRADAAGPNQSTPALALTAKLSTTDLAAYAAAGFDGVAGKPINVRELAQAIAPFMVGRAQAANDA
ncbi:MAG: response regulator [Hyphomonadaceae bacterium]|nr:response regulator [Hyphomonadaceae bacterium]